MPGENLPLPDQARSQAHGGTTSRSSGLSPFADPQERVPPNGGRTLGGTTSRSSGLSPGADPRERVPPCACERAWSGRGRFSPGTHTPASSRKELRPRKGGWRAPGCEPAVRRSTNPFRPSRSGEPAEEWRSRTSLFIEGLCRWSRRRGGAWGQNAGKAEHVKQGDPRGQAGLVRPAEVRGSVRAMNRGNARGAKGPYCWQIF